MTARAAVHHAGGMPRILDSHCGKQMAWLPGASSVHSYPQMLSASWNATATRQRMWYVYVQVTVQYNLCNEPWVKYSMAGVADRGLAPSLWTSARLHHNVLYLETHRRGSF